MAIRFCVPQFLPDVADETVVGYNVQSSPPVAGVPMPSGTWANVTGSPFTSNVNILDPTGTSSTYYRVQPVRQVIAGGTTYTLDTPWSRPFLASDSVYDMIFTRALLPALRFTYLGDMGVSQTNGTVLTETTGAGNGLWVFDGKTTRFNLQYVMNDDPIKVLDGSYTMTYIPSGQAQKTMVADVDYSVDARSGTVTFATAPAAGDYARFDFRRVDFVNSDLLIALTSAVNTLSSFGKSGYQTNQQYNLITMNQALEAPDLGEIVCKVAIFQMREGLTESALRSSTAWRDGASSVDPYPSRGLEFLVQKLQVTEQEIQRAISAYNKTRTQPRGRGEMEVFWDLTQLTPLIGGMWKGLPGAMYGGSMGAGVGGPFFPWYI